MSSVKIVHDWDFPVGRPLTNLKLSYHLFNEALLTKLKVKPSPPSYVNIIKLSHAKVLLKLDEIFNVKAVWGLTDEVIKRFPLFVEDLEERKLEIRYHSHQTTPEGKGTWVPSINIPKNNMIFDRRYCLQGRKKLPEAGETIVWHVDHPNNLPEYIELLQRLQGASLI